MTDFRSHGYDWRRKAPAADNTNQTSKAAMQSRGPIEPAPAATTHNHDPLDLSPLAAQLENLLSPLDEATRARLNTANRSVIHHQLTEKQLAGVLGLMQKAPSVPDLLIFDGETPLTHVLLLSRDHARSLGIEIKDNDMVIAQPNSHSKESKPHTNDDNDKPKPNLNKPLVLPTKSTTPPASEPASPTPKVKSRPPMLAKFEQQQQKPSMSKELASKFEQAKEPPKSPHLTKDVTPKAEQPKSELTSPTSPVEPTSPGGKVLLPTKARPPQSPKPDRKEPPKSLLAKEASPKPAELPNANKELSASKPDTKEPKSPLSPKEAHPLKIEQPTNEAKSMPPKQVPSKAEPNEPKPSSLSKDLASKFEQAEPKLAPAKLEPKANAELATASPSEPASPSAGLVGKNRPPQFPKPEPKSILSKELASKFEPKEPPKSPLSKDAPPKTDHKPLLSKELASKFEPKSALSSKPELKEPKSPLSKDVPPKAEPKSQPPKDLPTTTTAKLETPKTELSTPSSPEPTSPGKALFTKNRPPQFPKPEPKETKLTPAKEPAKPESKETKLTTAKPESKEPKSPLPLKEANAAAAKPEAKPEPKSALANNKEPPTIIEPAKEPKSVPSKEVSFYPKTEIIASVPVTLKIPEVPLSALKKCRQSSFDISASMLGSEGLSRISKGNSWKRRASTPVFSTTELDDLLPPVCPSSSTTDKKKSAPAAGEKKKRVVKKKTSLDGTEAEPEIDPITGEKIVPKKKKKIVKKTSKPKDSDDSSNNVSATASVDSEKKAPVTYAQPRPPSPEKHWPVQNEGNSEKNDEAKTAKKRIRFRKYNMDDFNFLNLLGRGSFGKVFLAELKNHNAYFAVKCMAKQKVIQMDDVENTMVERRVMAMGSTHPFICKMFCTFQTESHLCFVMEYLPGGDLMFLVQKYGKMSEDAARFYASEVISALKFLHKKFIIYRDLKLDNIVLDPKGHIRLVDFGMCHCKIYRSECLPTGFCGTPEYIAPEIVKGIKYNHLVDWWSFGVMLYEMATGRSPFTGTDEDELLWNVCNETVYYPRFLSKNLVDLLARLLETRLMSPGAEDGDITIQPFFVGINWDDVDKLNIKPPHRPEVSGIRDVSNFDTLYTEAGTKLTPPDEGFTINHELFKGFSYTNPNITD